MILKLFAGADGAGIGIARALPGVPSVGLELDADACATMARAGHPVIRCDIEQYPVAPFAGKVAGLWASPPCTDFSIAGKRLGVGGETGNLIFEVPRWAYALLPEWIVCEQTPLALPWWRDFARQLALDGYSTWAGILDAANYGVPQNRKRAILLASRVRDVGAPHPTHTGFPHPVLFGEELLPWVSAGEALGWTGSVRTGQSSELGAGRSVRYERSVDAPAPTVTGKAGGSWLLKPAPTVRGHRMPKWLYECPATTVQATPRIAKPGHHERQWEDSVPVTLEEMATIQDFPPGWPFVGNKTSVAKQIGNAVPSRLAEACVRAVAWWS